MILAIQLESVYGVRVSAEQAVNHFNDACQSL